MRAVRLPAALFALFALAALSAWRSSPPPPRGPDAPATEFSAARAEEVLERLLGDGAPRTPGSAAHSAFRERLHAEIGRLGLKPETDEGVACAPHGSCARLVNVLAELPGTGPGPAVLLTAHTDSVGAGSGASDDASGVAALLEAARALLAAPRRNPVLLLFDDGEEDGLLGAELFARSPRARSVAAVVNLEARGTSGPSLLFETSGENAWLVRRAVARLPRPVTSSLFAFVYDRLPNDTDLTVYKREGLAGLNLAFIGSAARYHTREDSLANLSRASLQHQGENALALARALAETDLHARPAGRAVFFSVAGAFVVAWPKAATPAVALLAFLLVRLACLRRGGRFLPRVRVLVPFLFPLVAALAGALAWQLLRALGAFPVAFVPRPWASLAAAVAAGLLAALPVLAAETRSTGGAVEAWERAWTSIALLGLVLALAWPETSYLLVAPALVAGLARLALPEGVSPWLPFAASGLVFLPLAFLLPDALGPVALPIVAAAFGIVLATLPLDGTRGAWTRPAGVLAGVFVVASAAALLLSKPTPDKPEHGTMVALEEAGVPGARLAYRPASGRLHPSVAAAARFEKAPGLLPWAKKAAPFASPLPPTSRPFPAVEVLETAPLPDGRRRLRLQLTSPRGAERLGLLFPDGTGVEEVRVEGRPLPPPYLRRRPAVGAPLRVFFRAAPAEGFVVELTLPAAPREAVVLDETPGLPATAAAIARSRPATVAPSGGGDGTVLFRKLSL
ncbi:MAG: M28 family peptidase [Thermoanaerobaculia bacterium]